MSRFDNAVSTGLKVSSKVERLKALSEPVVPALSKAEGSMVEPAEWASPKIYSGASKSQSLWL